MTKGNFGGNAGLILPGDLGHNPKLLPYAYDPQQAKALVKAAGYTRELDIKILLPEGLNKFQAMLGEGLEQGGFKVQFVPMEINEFMQKFQLPNLDQPVGEQDWDICVVRLFQTADHPYLDIYKRYFHEKGAVRWIEPDADLQRLIDQIAMEPDQSKQNLLLRQCEARVHHQAYILNLWTSPNVYVLNKHVHFPSQLSNKRLFLREVELDPGHWSLRP
jgi:ABC-type transport system substrate-binding protein